MPAASPVPRNRITASAEIVAVSGPGGGTRLPVMRSQVPLVPRRTPEAVYLVGAAAGPIGGDVLSLRIEVRAGAFLRLRTSAASIALPAVDGAESLLSVTASVAPGGRLEYLPEPLVVSAGARHVTDLRVTLAAGAALVLRDEVILGRHGEPGGSARTSLLVDYGERPLLRQALPVSGTDEASLSPAVLAGHRAVGNLLLAGPRTSRDEPVPSSPVPSSPTRAVMPLAGPGILVTALAHDAVSLRRQLDGFGPCQSLLAARELDGTNARTSQRFTESPVTRSPLM